MKAIRYSIIGAAWLVLASACAPETLRPQTGPADGLRAVIGEDLAATKSILLDNPGSKLSAYWEAGDEIGVFGGSSENLLFKLNAEDLSVDRKTADFRSESSIPSGKLSAYAPYQKDAKKDGEGMVVNFPAKQKYVFGNGMVMPDPAAHIMYGEGSKASGLTFISVTSLLKIGQIFEETTLVKSVEFRDLSGAPVSGAMKLTGGSNPKAEVTGDGAVITLDFGEGLEFGAGVMHPLFLLVPARNYAKGFELTFIDDKGGKTVKTVGTTAGKTLKRGVVYPIGAISTQEAPEGAKTVLKEGAMIMTPEMLDKVKLLETYKEPVRDPDGNPIKDRNGLTVERPVLKLLVHKDLNPAEGGWLIFDQPTATLPEGGIYAITSCEKWDDKYYRVEAHVEGNFAAPFEEVTVGDPVLDESGVILDDGGIPLDLASHLSEVLDAEGNPVQFGVDNNGKVVFSESDMAQMLGAALTKAKVGTVKYNPPKVSFKYAKDNGEVYFGAQMTLDTRLAVGIIQGELQYLYLTANPVFELSADFVLKAEWTWEKDMHFITLKFVPIMVAPGVVISPEIDIAGSMGLYGNIQFSASLKYTYDMGKFGVAYNIGNGFTFRHVPPQPSEMELKPEMGSLEGNVGASAKLSVTPYFSLYGVFGLGVKTDFGLKFGLHGDHTGIESIKVALTPELELVPRLIVASGWFSKNFKDLSIAVELDPIWERYLWPQVHGHANPIGPSHDIRDYRFKESAGGMTRYYWVKENLSNYIRQETGWGIMSPSMWMQSDGVKYYVESDKPTLFPWTAAVEVLKGKMSMPWAVYYNTPARAEAPLSVYDSFTDIQTVARYNVLDIPAGQSEPIMKIGVVDCKKDFPPGEWRAFRIVYINKTTGTVYCPVNHYENKDGEYISTKSEFPYIYYWPTNPYLSSYYDAPVEVEEKIYNNDLKHLPERTRDWTTWVSVKTDVGTTE